MIALLAVALVLAQGALAPLAGKVMCLAATPHEHADNADHASSCASHASHASHAVHASCASQTSHAAPRWPRVHEPAASTLACTHQDSHARQSHTVCAAHQGSATARARATSTDEGRPAPTLCRTSSPCWMRGRRRLLWSFFQSSPCRGARGTRWRGLGLALITPVRCSSGLPSPPLAC